MKEAMLYSRQEDGVVRCHLCEHTCSINVGREGICGVRRNSEGALYSLTYGEVAALALDPVEKKPLFHFLPGSSALSVAAVGCNFKCSFCQNFSLSQAPPDSRFSRTLAPEQLVKRALEENAASIAYTYSEPTVFFEYAYTAGRLARTEGIKNIFVTNGYMSEASHPLLLEFLDAANIDLKCFSDETYRKIMGGRLAPVLNNIRKLYAAGVWIEITTLLVPGLNDSEDEMKAIADFIASVSPRIPWHVSRFHPDYKMEDRAPTPIRSMRRALEIGALAGLKFVYTGNVGGQGNEDTRCPECGKTLIHRQGYEPPVICLRKNGCPECGTILPGLFDSSRYS